MVELLLVPLILCDGFDDDGFVIEKDMYVSLYQKSYNPFFLGKSVSPLFALTYRPRNMQESTGVLGLLHLVCSTPTEQW